MPTPSVRLLLLLLLTLLLTGCASTARYPENPALDRAPSRPQIATERPLGNSLIILTFSGGGSRAAALALGVLEELQATGINQGTQSLLDEVDMISAVSGGSIIAAYYGLYGERVFSDFRRDFLDRDIRAELRDRMLSVDNLSRLTSETFGSGDVLDEFLRERLYGEATLDQLQDNQGPRVIINATDLFKGSRFGFTRQQFSLICSDSTQFPVARAVAASSAVPLIFTPITLTNRAGSCNFPVPNWVHLGLNERDTNPRRYAAARLWQRYLKPADGPYIHLQDGGLADNLGLRAVLDHIVVHDGLRRGANGKGPKLPPQVVIISLDATAQFPTQWEKSESNPPNSAILDAATTAPINNYNFETSEYLRTNLGRWLDNNYSARCPRSTPCPIQLHNIQVRLEDITDSTTRDELSVIPTDFTLPPGSADKIIAAGRQLLRDHPSFRRLLNEYRAPKSRSN